MVPSLFAVCFLLLITQSDGTPHNQPYGTRLASRSLHKRATSHTAPTTYSWWSWSSTGGYKSGTSNSPPQQTSSETYSPAPTNESENYGAPAGSYAKPGSQTGYSKPNDGTRYTQPAAGSDAQTWLDNHNKYRRQYGAPDLTWNPDLVSASKTLTDKCVWQHTQNNKFGENMAAGQSSIKEVVDGWVNGADEKGSYQPTNPTYTHFTQVVWVQTTEVGCHMTTCQDVKGAGLPQSPVLFWGCNYNPPGNVIGQFAQNVKAAAGGSPAV